MATGTKAAVARFTPMTSQQVEQALIDMLASLPDAEDSDGSEIIARILQAESWDQTDVQGSLPDAEAMIPYGMIRVDRIGKKPSDIEGSLPFYLVVDGVALSTGEVITFQTSSRTVTAQLIRQHQLNALPVVGSIHKAEKKTRSGFYPLDFKVHSSLNGEQTTIDG